MSFAHKSSQDPAKWTRVQPYRRSSSTPQKSRMVISLNDGPVWGPPGIHRRHHNLDNYPQVSLLIIT